MEFYDMTIKTTYFYRDIEKFTVTVVTYEVINISGFMDS